MKTKIVILLVVIVLAINSFAQKGHLFGSQLIEVVDNSKVGSKILIEDVHVAQGDKIIKVPGMIITLK